MTSRLKTLEVSCELLLEMLRIPPEGRRIRCMKDAIPQHAEIVEARRDHFRGTVVLLLRSASFPEVPEGAEIPFLTPQYSIILHGRCERAKHGWKCSRGPGHPGPCAASLTFWTAVKLWFRGVFA